MLRNLGSISFVMAIVLEYFAHATVVHYTSKDFAQLLFLSLTILGFILIFIHLFLQKSEERKNQPVSVRILIIVALAVVGLGLILKIFHFYFANFTITLGCFITGISFFLEKNNPPKKNSSNLLDSE